MSYVMPVKKRIAMTGGFALLPIIIVLSLSSSLIFYLMEDGLSHLRIQTKLNQRVGLNIQHNLAIVTASKLKSPSSNLIFVPDTAEFACKSGISLQSHNLNQRLLIYRAN